MADEQSKNMVAEGAPVITKEQETGRPPDLVSYLSKLPGAPSKEKIEAWKLEHGEVMVSGFDEDELFVFRPLSRREHTTLQKKLRTKTEAGEPIMDEFQYEEEVVSTCILWSSVADITSKGGTISTLSEQIMQNSNFTSPQLASMLVMKL